MRLGTYTDTLELENEMLRNKVKELTAQLKPYLDAEQKRLEYLKQHDDIDQGINNMMNLFYNKQYLK
jgi:hypothetical protein